MKLKFAKAACLIASLLSILAFPVRASATSQGTNGTELDILQPQQVEIQLGPNWSGVEFHLKTDAGMYPGTILVGEDGILRFEVGGSDQYILTCLNSQPQAPDPVEKETNESAPADDTENQQAEDDQEPVVSDPTISVDISGEDAPIATKEVILFGVGLVIALGILIFLLSGQKRDTQTESESDDDLF